MMKVYSNTNGQIEFNSKRLNLTLADGSRFDLYEDQDGNLVVMGDRSFTVQPMSANLITVVPYAK